MSQKPEIFFLYLACIYKYLILIFIAIFLCTYKWFYKNPNNANPRSSYHIINNKLYFFKLIFKNNDIFIFKKINIGYLYIWNLPVKLLVYPLF